MRPDLPHKPYFIRKRTGIIDRAADVAALYLQGKTHAQIAAELEISTKVVASDLKGIRQKWLDSALIDFDARKAQELAKIDHLESEAWEAWERSKRDYLSHTTRAEKVRRNVGGSDGAKRGRHVMEPLRIVEETTAREQNGDPRFLEQVSWCIETRVKILGIIRPGDTNNNIVMIDWEAMVRAAAGVSPQLVRQTEDDLEKRIRDASSTAITVLESGATPVFALDGSDPGPGNPADPPDPPRPESELLIDNEKSSKPQAVRPKIIRRGTYLGR